MFFSQSKPNIDSVIPAMDYTDQQLTNSALDPKYSKSIKTAITLGKRTLNRYYDLTDHSEIYRIAMGKAYFVNSLFYVSHYDPSTSLTPLPQARLLQESWLERRMDHCCSPNCSWWIWTVIRRAVSRRRWSRVDGMYCFSFRYGMSSSNLIFSRRPQSHSTSSTISLPLHLPRQQISVMNSTASLAQIPKVWWMFWPGGMKNVIFFLVSPEWR